MISGDERLHLSPRVSTAAVIVLQELIDPENGPSGGPSRELVPLVDPWDTFREQLSAVCCSTWSSHTQHSC